MARRLRISPLAAAALGPEAMRILQEDLAGRAQKIQDDARTRTPRASGRFRTNQDPEPILRVASERVDQRRLELPAAPARLCPCGDDLPCMSDDCGYPWCRSCREHHRAPECAIDVEGRALNPYTGEPWE